MQGIQYSSLTDEEFDRLVYAALGNVGALPPEVAIELAVRLNKDREKERVAATNNPNQLTLPLDQ